MVEEIINNSIARILVGLASYTGLGWLITIIVCIFTFLTIFLLFKNFRRAIYGSVVNGILLGVYKFSRFIGVSAQQGDFEPLKFFGWIVGWIISAIIIGCIVEKLRFVKNLEEKIMS